MPPLQQRFAGPGLLALVLIFCFLATAGNAAGGLSSSEFLLSSTPTTSECNAAVACNGTNFLVAWRSATNIHATLLNRSGATVGNPFVVNDSPVSVNASSSFVGVDWNGHDFLVVRTDEDGVLRGRRISGGGLVLGNEFVIDGNASRKVLSVCSSASDGTNDMVVYRVDTTDESPVSSICGVRIDGVNSLSPFQISSGLHHFVTSPEIAFNGTNYLVAWEYFANGYYSSATEGSQVQCARISANGVVLDTTPIVLFTAANSTPESYFHYAPSVASDGKDFLVVWDDERNYETRDADIFAARVSGDGVLMDTNNITVASTTSTETGAKAVFQNGAYLVGWISFAINKIPQDLQVQYMYIQTNGTTGAALPLQTRTNEYDALNCHLDDFAADAGTRVLAVTHSESFFEPPLLSGHFLDSSPSIQEVAQTNGIPQFKWFALPGKYYQVQWTTNLMSAGWTNLSSTILATGNSISYQHTNASGGQGFYRIVQQP